MHGLYPLEWGSFCGPRSRDMKNIMCIFSVLLFSLGAFKAMARGQESSSHLENVLLAKITQSPKMNAQARAGALQQIYLAMGKGRYQPSDEGLVFLAAAVLHSYHKDTRYVALPYVKSAILRRPGLPNEKIAATAWKIFDANFNEPTPKNEITMAGIAALMQGATVASLGKSRYFYFLGSKDFSNGKYENALLNFAKVELESAQYRRTKFVEGAAMLALGRVNMALTSFQMVIGLDFTKVEEETFEAKAEAEVVKEQAVLQVARILYELKRFGESLAYYRTLRQESLLFQESLAEQSWAFFMAGYPNRAMGAIYAVKSPFFAKYFNPDSYFLDAVISYWLCDFAGAKEKLEKFVRYSRDEGDALRAMVVRFSNESETNQLERYFRVANDAFDSVSPRNIGLGSRVLASLLRKAEVGETLSDIGQIRLVRENIKSRKLYKEGSDRIDFALADFEKTLRLSVGAQARSRLRATAQSMDEALMRARFLHLEVLMATKDALVGKERSVKDGDASLEQNFMDVGETENRNWNQDKNEFWFDELGSYVFKEVSKCRSLEAQIQ